MKILAYALTGLVLTATVARAEPAAHVTGSIQGDATNAARPALPAEPAAPVVRASAVDAVGEVSAALSDTAVDSFARATLRLQQIQADATIVADQKQTAVAMALSEAGLDPATFNEIGAKVSEDADLRARVQTAMARHAEHSDG